MAHCIIAECHFLAPLFHGCASGTQAGCRKTMSPASNVLATCWQHTISILLGEARHNVKVQIHCRERVGVRHGLWTGHCCWGRGHGDERGRGSGSGRPWSWGRNGDLGEVPACNQRSRSGCQHLRGRYFSMGIPSLFAFVRIGAIGQFCSHPSICKQAHGTASAWAHLPQAGRSCACAPATSAERHTSTVTQAMLLSLTSYNASMRRGEGAHLVCKRYVPRGKAAAAAAGPSSSLPAHLWQQPCQFFSKPSPTSLHAGLGCPPQEATLASKGSPCAKESSIERHPGRACPAAAVKSTTEPTALMGKEVGMDERVQNAASTGTSGQQALLCQPACSPSLCCFSLSKASCYYPSSILSWVRWPSSAAPPQAPSLASLRTPVGSWVPEAVCPWRGWLFNP